MMAHGGNLTVKNQLLTAPDIEAAVRRCEDGESSSEPPVVVNGSSMVWTPAACELQLAHHKKPLLQLGWGILRVPIVAG